MPIKLVCPACKKSGMAPDSLAGKKVKCPGCQAVIDVPAGIPAYKGDTKLAAKPAPAPPARPAAAPAAPAGPPGKSISCPKCQKAFPADAVICIECGINLRTGDKIITKIG